MPVNKVRWDLIAKLLKKYLRLLMRRKIVIIGCGCGGLQRAKVSKVFCYYKYSFLNILNEDKKHNTSLNS